MSRDLFDESISFIPVFVAFRQVLKDSRASSPTPLDVIPAFMNASPGSSRPISPEATVHQLQPPKPSSDKLCHVEDDPPSVVLADAVVDAKLPLTPGAADAEPAIDEQVVAVTPPVGIFSFGIQSLSLNVRIIC